MKPGYIASPERLATVRKQRTVAMLMRQIERGDWKRFLIQCQKAAHRYPSIKQHSGEIAPLLVKVNVVRSAIRLHVQTLAGKPVTISTPEGFDQQRVAVELIRQQSHFDALLMQAVRTANIDGWSTLRVDMRPGVGLVVCCDDNAMILPVGPDGADMQPSVFERRWFIKRSDPIQGKKTYLRVERHWAPDGQGRVDQEVYQVKNEDAFVDLNSDGVTRVDLAKVFPENTPAELTLTGVPYPLITRLVNEYFDGRPEMLMSEHDFDLLDMSAAAISRLDRTMEQHGNPKVRIPENLINNQTGKAEIGEAIVDADKLFEYIDQKVNFDAMFTAMNKTLQLLCTQLQASPALLGFKLDGGAMPDTFDKLRLEATQTLARAETSAKYMGPALGRVFTTASMLDTQLPMRGYPVAPVSVVMHPGLPKDQLTIAREMRELRGTGEHDAMVDLQTVIEAVHGEAAAPQILERLKAERDETTRRNQQEIYGAFNGGAA
ncbi:MAG: hypothetical protein CMJ35_03715 [Phycisphaerae bacterium]|nr:hypothetical protein [Phycisphaerae bacterium]MBM90706.1 hypothetical protein [Phycisphaerae bacterium]